MDDASGDSAASLLQSDPLSHRLDQRGKTLGSRGGAVPEFRSDLQICAAAEVALVKSPVLAAHGGDWQAATGAGRPRPEFDQADLIDREGVISDSSHLSV